MVHQTAPTQFIAVGGTRLAYRRFGKHGDFPLIFFQHFSGNMDNWDPQVIDGFAQDREVILFDNVGVASSDGNVPPTIEGMAQTAIAFMTTLRIPKADLLGFSMGSFVAQQIAAERPDLVHRLILVGSSPRGGVAMETLTPEFRAALSRKREVPDELLLETLFSPSTESQAAGRRFLTRIRARTADRDREVNQKGVMAQTSAIAAWGAPRTMPYAYLKSIKQPVLVVDGDRDIVFYTINSINLQRYLPNAELIVYPDANHGSIYQYPEMFLAQARSFLDQT